MIESLLSYQASGVVLALMVIAAAWIWEDAAAIAGALLAADGKLGVGMALAAVFIGICSGDLALYYLGRLSRRWRSLRARLLLSTKFRAVQRRFRRKTLLNILLIRFVPGLRTLGFSMCGLWRVPALTFVAAMLTAGVIWVAIIFTSVYMLGGSSWLLESQWKWSLMGVALLLLVFNNLYFNVHLRPKISDKNH